jgi:hypothetical protein
MSVGESLLVAELLEDLDGSLRDPVDLSARHVLRGPRDAQFQRAEFRPLLLCTITERACILNMSSVGLSGAFEVLGPDERSDEPVFKGWEPRMMRRKDLTRDQEGRAGGHVVAIEGLQARVPRRFRLDTEPMARSSRVGSVR